MIRYSDLSIIFLIAYVAVSSGAYILTGTQPAGGYLDEVLLLGMLLLALPLWISKPLPEKFVDISVAISFFLLIGIFGASVNSTLEGYPAIIAAFQAVIIDTKFPIFVLLSLTLFQNDYIKNTRIICITIIVLGFINGIFSIFDIIKGVDFHGRQLANRSGLFVPNGIYDHKFKSAFLNVLFFAAALHMRWNWAGIFAFILCMLSLSVKEMLAATLILALAGTSMKNKISRHTFIVALLFAIFSISVTNNPIKTSVLNRFNTFLATDSPTTTVRTELYRVAPKLAINYFPLGSGAGSFGSSPSRDVYYSPIYHEYQISHLHGGGVGEDGSFLIDTFWPKILGEYGIFGFLAFCVPLSLAGRSRNSPAFARYLFWGMLIISIGTPVYNYSEGAIFGGLITGFMILSRRKSEANDISFGKIYSN